MSEPRPTYTTKAPAYRKMYTLTATVSGGSFPAESALRQWAGDPEALAWLCERLGRALEWALVDAAGAGGYVRNVSFDVVVDIPTRRRNQ